MAGPEVSVQEELSARKRLSRLITPLQGCAPRRWLALQGARERAEFGDGELLGACRRGDAGALEQPVYREPERLQAGSQHLAALAKR